MNDATTPGGPAEPDFIPSGGLDVPVVGISAPASGLVPLIRLFERLPSDLGMAFVVMAHPSSGLKALPSLIQAATRMTVVRPTQPVGIEPNTVYVAPPNKALSVTDRCLRVADLERASQMHDELEQRLQQRTVELASTHAALISESTGRQLAEQSSRDLLAHMMQSVEGERSRISRELHDTLGQQLTLLGVHLKSIELDVADRPQAADLLRSLVATVQEMETQIDRLSQDLRPSALDDLGLEEAMRAYIEAWTQETGVACELHTYGLGKERPPMMLESTVYRVMQEALTNVHKHAQARRVGVIVERSHRKLRMVLEDDGVGFDSTGPRHPGQLGLLGMAERAALVAGTLEVESVPGMGTTVYLSLPVVGDSTGADAA